MVPLLCSPEDAVSLFSKKNFKYRFVSFPLELNEIWPREDAGAFGLCSHMASSFHHGSLTWIYEWHGELCSQILVSGNWGQFEYNRKSYIRFECVAITSLGLILIWGYKSSNKIQNNFSSTVVHSSVCTQISFCCNFILFTYHLERWCHYSML